MGSKTKYAISWSSIAFDRVSTALAHQLAWAVCSAPGLAAVLAPAGGGGPHRQHCGCLVHQLAGRSTIKPNVTTRLLCPVAPASYPLESDVAQIAACHPHSRGAQTTAHVPWRMATPSRDNPADLESIQGSSGGPVCFPWVLPLPAVLFPDWGPPRHRHAGTQLASGSTQVYVIKYDAVDSRVQGKWWPDC